jgi:nucleotide-binding universal stress UspA family protein
MLKRILCPIDFSIAARNAAEYAANLAQVMNASLRLFHVQPIYIGDGVSLFSGGDQASVLESAIAQSKIQTIASDLSKVFKIECQAEVVSTIEGFSKAFAESVNEQDLVVTGTNGASNLFEFYFGTHSYRVSRKVSVPVVIVPEEFKYAPVSKIVFASDYDSGDSLFIKQLENILQMTKSQLEVIHVSTKDTVLNAELYRTFVSYTEDTLSNPGNVKFQRIISDQPDDAVEKYAVESGADMIAVQSRDHSIAYRLFHQNLIKSLAEISRLPVLIFHS